MANNWKQLTTKMARHSDWGVSRRRICCVVACIGCLSVSGAFAAELSVGTLLMRAGSDGQVVVSGSIAGEATIGVTIRLEIRPRPGSIGTVEFTPVEDTAPLRRGSIAVHHQKGRASAVSVIAETAADADIVQAGDPWPDQGTFSTFDTDRTTAATLNGTVDDNGTFIPTATEYHGTLSAFPIRVSAGASGVWDVVLSTSRGDSSWEGVPTILQGATVTVASKACVSAADCGDSDACTVDRCVAGVCVHEIVDESCTVNQTRKKRGQTRRP